MAELGGARGWFPPELDRLGVPVMRLLGIDQRSEEDR